MAASLLLAGAIGIVVYTYLLFPLLLVVRAKLRPRPVAAADTAPTISVIIAAHDEAAVIGTKLETVLATPYPRDRLEVVVASDGSADGTEDIVRRFADRGVQLLALSRVGKATALNRAVAVARGEVLVFTDANSILDRGALAALVRPFADPAVGGVAGDQRYAQDADAGGMASGEQRYWSYDRLLKTAGSRGGHVTSATGALYAIRRTLFQDVPDGVTDDFFVSTGVISQGVRLVFAPQAVAREPVAADGRAEFSRKVRIMTRGLYGVRLRRDLLDPRRHGFYALQLFTHKVLRRAMAVPLLLIAASSLVLAEQGPAYRVLALAQLAFYGLAAVGAVLSTLGVRRRGGSQLAAYVCLVNVASLVALWNVVRGTRIDRWDTAERKGPDVAARPARVTGAVPSAGQDLEP
jgi:glycosyltransferase involved in cell wall biosynthesis